MSHPFKVTGLGLQVDKTMILPGSQLVLSRPAPGHWSRFGEAGSDAKEMTVATPEAAVSAPEQAGDLKAQAEELGIKIDGRWGDDRIQAEIDKALAD